MDEYGYNDTWCNKEEKVEGCKKYVSFSCFNWSKEGRKRNRSECSGKEEMDYKFENQ